MRRLRGLNACNGASRMELVKSCCSWGTGTIREPRGRGKSVVRIRYQRTSADTVDGRTKCVLQWTVGCEDPWTVRVNCNYKYKRLINLVTNPKPTSIVTLLGRDYILVHNEGDNLSFVPTGATWLQTDEHGGKCPQAGLTQHCRFVSEKYPSRISVSPPPILRYLRNFSFLPQNFP
jgi:hypothetical protein